MIALSASQLVVAAAVVVVAVVVLWPAVDVAVVWFVVAVLSVESVLTFPSWAAAVQSDPVVSVVVDVFFWSPLSRISPSADDAIRTFFFRTLDRWCSV